MLFLLNIKPCKKSTNHKTKADTCVACYVKVILNKLLEIPTSYFSPGSLGIIVSLYSKKPKSIGSFQKKVLRSNVLFNLQNKNMLYINRQVLFTDT